MAAAAAAARAEAAEPPRAAPVRVNTARMSDRYYADALRAALAELGWAEVRGTTGADADAEVVWWDGPVARAHFALVRPGQAISRFHGMVRLCRKVCFAHQLRWAVQLYGGACDVAPQTWCLPEQLDAFRAHAKAAYGGSSAEPGEYFIVKPDAGCQGDGIALLTADGVERRSAAARRAGVRAVVQAYVPRPLLLRGHKFDLRLYALLLSAQPFEAYLCTRGLARFATQPYAPAAQSRGRALLAHLTNSTLNAQYAGGSNKRSWAAVLAALAASGGLAPAGAAGGAWAAIARVVCVALRAICPLAAALQTEAASEARLAAPGRFNFQLIGVDVLLDEDGRAWLLELNHSPSMALIDADDDERAAKVGALAAALRLATCTGPADVRIATICEAHAIEPLHALPWPPAPVPPADACAPSEAAALFLSLIHI